MGEAEAGASFGAISGVITALGVLWGLSVTGNGGIVLLGVLATAVSDALSDAFAMHASREAGGAKDVRSAPLHLFAWKVLTSAAILLVLIAFDGLLAYVLATAVGLAVISFVSWQTALERGDPPMRTVGEHVLFALIVMALTWAVGNLAEWMYLYLTAHS